MKKVKKVKNVKNVKKVKKVKKKPDLSEGPAEPLFFGGETIEPGEIAHLDLNVARLPTYTRMGVPVIVRHGVANGPRVWIIAALHGDELNGIEIIHRVLQALEGKPQERGTVIAVPIVNVFGFIHQSRYLPDGRDLNRSFPGSNTGSLASRMARLFMDEIVGNCTHGIDLHTGSGHRTNLPQVRANMDDPATADFATSFGAPFTMHSKIRDGSLRDATSRRNCPVLVFEGGESQRFDESAIEVGTQGVLRALRHLGVIDVPVEPGKPSCVLRKSSWLRAKQGGLLRLSAGLGDRIEKGEVIGSIGDPFGGSRLSVKATAGGVVIGHALNPVVYQGDAVVHIATG